MDNKSAITSEAAPVVIEPTTHLQKVNREPNDDVEKDTNDEKISMEILQGLADLLQKIEEKINCRFQKMEEKMDLLISSINVKAEAENMSIDESSFAQEPDDGFRRFSDFPHQRSYERFDRFLYGPGRGQQTYDRSGRGQQTDHRFGPFFNGRGQYTDERFSPFFNGRGRGLDVGGRFAGGRCGGQGFCGYC
ncbi:unnamed protein product [Eruca vesicaria subsp. sativa]|uniref:Uncharacterized protein n=1 Tax=Eruca vesicaria subsp. sativa TaxID=29727 RepID=A0ABC8K6J1_ERUVS|nr:unnamed protein product [Eruca vesicaria subsp. sativa]